jgi:hypothetical protein
LNDINDLAPKIFIDIIIKTLYTLYMIRNEREIEMSKEITANEMMMQNMELTVDGKIVPISDNSEVESAIAFGLKDDFRDVFDALSDAYAGHEWQLMNNSSGEIYAHSDYDQGSAWYYGMDKKEDDMAWLPPPVYMAWLRKAMKEVK